MSAPQAPGVRLKSDTTRGLPPGWATAALGEITTIVSGSTPKTSVPEYWGGDIAWITPDDLSKSRSKSLAEGARSLTQAGYDSCSTTLMPAGSVLYSSRAPIGYVAIATGPVCTNQGFKSFIPSAALTSDYLYWFLIHATPSIRELGSGTTFPELSKKAASSVVIPFAPLNEQRRIVAAIEEHLSRLDAADASLVTGARRVVALGESLDSRLLHGWELRVLGDICPVFVDCPHRTPTYVPDGIPALRPRDVVGGKLDLADAARVDRSEFDVQTRRRVPEAGDVIYSRELSFGWAVVVPPTTELCMSQGMVLFRPDDSILPEFLVVVLNGSVGRGQAQAAATGSAHPHINLRDIRAYQIPVPPLEEQRRIVARVEEQLSAIDALRASIERAQRRSASLRRAILERAFRGELVPQDPTDEPAEQLLARIRAERDAAPNPRRGGHKRPKLT